MSIWQIIDQLWPPVRMYILPHPPDGAAMAPMASPDTLDMGPPRGQNRGVRHG